MKIHKLKMKNWKSFTSHTEVFDDMNIINYPNGYGKTSMFEAIIFALYGKRPSGWSFSDLSNDPEKESIVELDFSYSIDDKFHDIKIIRKFKKSSSVVLYQDGQQITTSAGKTIEFINNIVPYNIISVMWSEDSLKYSDILKPDFIINEIFSYIFRDPNTIISEYKKKIYVLNQNIKSLEKDININVEKDIEIVVLNIEHIKNQIKDGKKGSYTKEQYMKALSAQEAFKKIENINVDKIPTLDIISKWKRVVNGQTPSAAILNLDYTLRLEKTKQSESPMSKIPSQTLKYIKDESEKIGKSIITGQQWRPKYSKNINKLLEEGIADENLIERLEKTIEFIKKYTSEEISNAEIYWNNERIASQVPNFEEIIKTYDENSNLLWGELEKLENRRRILDIQKKEFKNYNKLKSEMQSFIERRNKVQEYITLASEYYSDNVTMRASEILNNLNPRYDQLYLEDGKYYVSVLGESMQTLSLSKVHKLSSGERTLVAISIILAAHNLFFPDMPLLFDESFSSLDKENISSLKPLFKNSGFQTFIITHDKYWTE